MLRLTTLNQNRYDPIVDSRRGNGGTREGRPSRFLPQWSHGLANLFLVDHSLRNTEGHHFDYVQCLSRAATEAGLQTIIGAHRDFRSNQLENVWPHFRDTTYQASSYLAGLRHLKRQAFNFAQPPDPEAGLLKRFKYFRSQKSNQRKRVRFVRKFAQDCHSFFGRHEIRSGDHAFFTTVSELELAGLAKYLAANPKTLKANWHLQFHFNLFEGRTPEYASQFTTVQQVRDCFRLAKANVPFHQIHFYTTSQILADQYRRLKAGPFNVLPYPIANCFRPGQIKDNEKQGDDGPIRFTCPGGIRREKGHVRYLQPLVDQIWESHLRPGKAKLVLQRPPRKKMLGEKIALKCPANPLAPKSTDLDLINSTAVEYHPHPLPANEYERLIKSTDCGLLFYNSRHYFSRRAGVMGELLSCGRPVIVPAGSWLSEQIKEGNFSHRESLSRSAMARRTLPLSDLTCGQSNVPLPGGIVSFDQSRTPFEANFEMQHDETAFVVRWKWHWPVETGSFAKVELLGEAGDTECTELAKTQTAAGRITIRAQTAGIANKQFGSVIFRNPQLGKASTIRLRFRNAFHNSTATIKDLQIVTLGGDNGATPLGIVGISAADESNLPGCVEEMVQHYDHYQRSASQFAEKWYEQHEPRRTITHLLSVEQLQRKAA